MSLRIATAVKSFIKQASICTSAPAACGEASLILLYRGVDLVNTCERYRATQLLTENFHLLLQFKHLQNNSTQHLQSSRTQKVEHTLRMSTSSHRGLSQFCASQRTLESTHSHRLISRTSLHLQTLSAVVSTSLQDCCSQTHLVIHSTSLLAFTTLESVCLCLLRRRTLRFEQIFLDQLTINSLLFFRCHFLKRATI